ncbi:hypothetical protein TRFO_02711 [Tritrichomonas foetus]|uniref:Uncharacterized protein n=1 Tax=Tritrichomonas foetus TaxID=1144522 RepID=A0A1J4KYX1_9EUKA|nr:hypothetical protein TRFO_02711 [Tritrichomonas foetus]|eukprot:OHT16447.1 hypothetical protein TRFO_02711 [Tritrichomonas foetus]
MSHKHETKEVPEAEEEPEEKKKKKTNLRRSKNQEDMKYATSTADLLACAHIASAGLEQRHQMSKKRDEERMKKQKERDEIKEEKRLARFERSQARKNKIKDAASASSAQDKKEMIREMLKQKHEESKMHKGGKQKNNRRQRDE